MRLTPEQKLHTEQRIRAAIDRILSDETGRYETCSVRTLAHEAGVTRSALYSTYSHLKQEFEVRRDRESAAPRSADNHAAQVEQLRATITKLQSRLALRDQQVADLRAFKTTALSRLLSQHDEIVSLRAACNSPTNVSPILRSP